LYLNIHYTKQLHMEHKVKKAKFISLLYFIILGIVNLGASLVNGQLIALDLIIVALAVTPIVINYKSCVS